MPLQDITPINDQLADIIVRADEPWIETEPGMAWMKVLWTGAETGRWEDTEYLFICEGPVLFYDKDGLTNYLSWEELARMKEAAKSGQDTKLNVSAATLYPDMTII